MNHKPAIGGFDRIVLEFLEARDERQWDGFRLGTAGTDQQQALSVLHLGDGGGAGVVMRFVFHARHDFSGKAIGIEDHDHGTVAQDGRAGIGANAPQGVGERLDDDFLGIEHIVDDQADIAPASIQHDDEAGIDLGSIAARADAEDFLQVNQRHKPVTQAHHPRPAQ